VQNLQHELHGLTIRARVSELREQREKQEDLVVEKAIEKAAISRAWVLQELRENAARAKKRGRGAVVNRALELIGKEIGMFVDQPQKKIGLDDLSLEALEALLAELESDPEVIAGMAEHSTLALAPPQRR
jgi:phage terminase small subunit